MGLSGKVDKLINVDKAKELNLPVIKRFSGGGTVVVDHSTFCLTFILNKVNCYHYLYFEEWFPKNGFPYTSDGLEWWILYQGFWPDKCPFFRITWEWLCVWWSQICWKCSKYLCCWLINRFLYWSYASPHIFSLGLWWWNDVCIESMFNNMNMIRSIQQNSQSIENNVITLHSWLEWRIMYHQKRPFWVHFL